MEIFVKELIRSFWFTNLKNKYKNIKNVKTLINKKKLFLAFGADACDISYFYYLLLLIINDIIIF